VKTQKIVDSSNIYIYLDMTVKEMFGKFVGTTNMIAACLELSAYSSEFSWFVIYLFLFIFDMFI